MRNTDEVVPSFVTPANNVETRERPDFADRCLQQSYLLRKNEIPFAADLP